MPELVEKRTRNSKTHHLGGRKYSWDGTIGSIHYEDNGWQEIDNIFEPALAPWDWEMLKAGYHIRVKEDFTAGQIIEFEKQGETVQFQPMALEWTNDLDQIQPIAMPASVTPAITNPEVDLLPAVGMLSHQGTIRWNDAYGEGIDFEWKCTSTRLVKILEIENLNKLSVPEQYILDGGNPVLRLNLIFDPSSGVGIYVDGELWDKKTKVQTFNRIGFWKDGEELWGFLPLKYWGSNLESEDNNGRSIATLEKRANKLYISIRVPYDWLQSAVYPVFVDTDIDPQPAQVGASADNGYCYETSWNSMSTLLRYGRYNASIGRMFGRLSSVTIPDGSTIDSNTYISVYQANVWGDPEIKISADDQQDPSAPTNCAGLDGITPTTNQVDWDVALDSGWNDSPPIQSVIQELVTSFDYSSGAPIQILLKNDKASGIGLLDVRGYAYTGNIYGLKLHIEYSAGGETHEGAATLSGTGTLAGIGQGVFIGKSTLSGTGTLASLGRLIATGKATLSGAGTLSGIGSYLRYGVVALAGTGSLVVNGVIAAIGKATLSGTGTLAAIGRRIFTGAATLSGTGNLVASAVTILIGKATLSGTGTLVAKGVGILISKATLVGAGTLTGIGRLIAIGKATLSGTGTLAVVGAIAGVIHYASVALSGTGSLVAKGVGIFIGKATLSGTGSLSIIGRLIRRILFTVYMHSRALNVYLHPRSLITKLHKRSLDVETRSK